MKPLYIGIIVVVLLIVIFSVRARNARRDAEIASSNPGGNNQNITGSSSAAQIINSLFPFFQTGVMAIKK